MSALCPQAEEGSEVLDTKGTGRGEDAGGWGGRKGRQRARLFQETLLPSSGIRSTERICRGTVLMLLSTGWWLEQPRDANNVLRCCQAQGAYQTCQVRHKKQEESRRIARGLRAASAPTAPSPDDAVHEPAATPSWLASLRRYTADFHHKKTFSRTLSNARVVLESMFRPDRRWVLRPALHPNPMLDVQQPTLPR